MNRMDDILKNSFLVSLCSLALLPVSQAIAADSKIAPSNKASAAPGKPKNTKILVRSWKELFPDKRGKQRTYNIFKRNVVKPVVDTSNPENWQVFDPAMYKQKADLVPNPSVLTGVCPSKYLSEEISIPQDPAQAGTLTASGTTIVFAHQGTPLSNGWIAPKAGYAYQINNTLVYGTSNYTPINYNGEMSKYIGLNRVPVDIQTPSGGKEKLDLSRLVFAVNDDLVSRPQSKVYPAVIYLKPGESAAIQGYGTVKCPTLLQPEKIAIQTPNGEQSIKIICQPEKPIVPGKVTP